MATEVCDILSPEMKKKERRKDRRAQGTLTGELHMARNGAGPCSWAETALKGGARNSNVNSLGPIILQGDHSGCDFRNMVLTPILSCPDAKR